MWNQLYREWGSDIQYGGLCLTKEVGKRPVSQIWGIGRPCFKVVHPWSSKLCMARSCSKVFWAYNCMKTTCYIGKLCWIMFISNGSRSCPLSTPCQCMSPSVRGPFLLVFYVHINLKYIWTNIFEIVWSCNGHQPHYLTCLKTITQSFGSNLGQIIVKENHW